MFFKKVIFLMLLYVACLEAYSGERAYDASYDETRDPFSDVELAIVDARLENKNILLKFGGEWCSWCHILENFIANNSQVYALYDATFVPVKVNVSGVNQNEAFTAQFPSAKGYPFFVILDQDGKAVGSLNTALLESGRGYSVDKFMAFIRKYQI